MPTCAQIFDLGEQGYVAKVATGNEKESSKNGKLPHPVVIMDRSGSMGHYAARAVDQIIPSVLRRLGYSESDPVFLITFDSYVEKYSTTVSQMKNLGIRCRGTTNMAEVFPILKDFIRELPIDHSINLIAISDGHIFDKESAVTRAKNLAADLDRMVRSAPIGAAMFQMMSSSNAEADTRGLACIGQLASTGSPQLVRLDTESSSRITAEVALLQCVEQMTEVLQPITAKTGKLQGSGFRRMPTDSPSSSMDIATGAYILVDPGTDLTKITFNDEPVEIVDFKEVSSEDDILEFLRYAEAQLRTKMVVDSANADIDATIAWFNQLENKVSEAAAKATGDSSGTGSGGTKARAKVLASQIRKRRGSVIGNIMQLRNAGKVSALNNQQQAEFLRGISSDKRSSRRLANRVADTDFDAHVANDLVKMSRPKSSGKNHHDEVSFFGCETFVEPLETAYDELRPVADEVTKDDVLPIVGGLGIAYWAYQGDLPDPWQMKIRKVYIGTSYLSEQDLVVAKQQSPDEQIKYPGTDEPITGVCPLRALDPDSYNFYYNELHSIAEIQASYSIRGMIAPVPNDILARDSAVYLKMCMQTTGCEPTEIEAKILESLKFNIVNGMSKTGKKFAELAELLSSSNCAAYLTGDMEVSTYVKPFAIAAAHSKFSHGSNFENVFRLARAVYGLDMYHAARQFFGKESAEARKTAMFELLAIDIQANRKELTPLFEVDPDFDSDSVPKVSIDVVIEGTKQLDWSQGPGIFHGILKQIAGTTDYGCDEDLMWATATVSAIACSKQEDRVDTETRTVKIPEFSDAEACENYIQSIVVDYFREDYESRQNAKAKQEAIETMKRAINEMVATKTTKEFLRLLNEHIPNRVNSDFPILEKRLCDLDAEVPRRTEKLYIIITGRVPNGRVVWNSGNYYPDSMFHFMKLFEKLGEKKIWNDGILEAIPEEERGYRYRGWPHGLENRHGYGNDNPSDWAKRQGNNLDLSKYKIW